MAKLSRRQRAAEALRPKARKKSVHTKSKTAVSSKKTVNTGLASKDGQDERELRSSKKITGSFRLTARAFRHVWLNKKLFVIISATYLFLVLLLVRGFVFSADLTIIKEAITEVFQGSVGQVAGSLAVIGILSSSLNPQTEIAGLYQTILIVIFSLIMIWTLRQTYAGEKPSVKDVFYKSSYPLIPFILVLLVIGLQMIPLLLSSVVYSGVIGGGIAVTGLQITATMVVVFLLAFWTIYLLTASLFALYIVALPDMTPLQALRAAKKLVKYRRWSVMRKVLFLPFGLTVIGFSLFLPVVLLVPAVAEITFLLGSSLILPIAHSYLYSLYRELLA